jgi:hypothetical protein
VDDLVQFSWIKFIQYFEGFNLEVAHDFAKTFDGTKAKIGYIQLQVSEESIAEETGLSHEGDRWFKNKKIVGIPWHSCWSPKSHVTM